MYNICIPETLAETASMMDSTDYKERFKAEYYQLKIRYEKLQLMIEKLRAGELEFTPVCKEETLGAQLIYMLGYLKVLEYRAKQEGIVLD